mmetsp:Transcript_36535/g.88838  ORF Transcript_36535/g.88838 Transcript_36535/m.88838 type:complete len:403 (+) Transcript_36535:592-1800(+)
MILSSLPSPSFFPSCAFSAASAFASCAFFFSSFLALVCSSALATSLRSMPLTVVACLGAAAAFSAVAFLAASSSFVCFAFATAVIFSATMALSITLKGLISFLALASLACSAPFAFALACSPPLCLAPWATTFLASLAFPPATPPFFASAAAPPLCWLFAVGAGSLLPSLSAWDEAAFLLPAVATRSASASCPSTLLGPAPAATRAFSSSAVSGFFSSLWTECALALASMALGATWCGAVCSECTAEWGARVCPATASAAASCPSTPSVPLPAARRVFSCASVSCLGWAASHCLWAAASRFIASTLLLLLATASAAASCPSTPSVPRPAAILSFSPAASSTAGGVAFVLAWASLAEAGAAGLGGATAFSLCTTGLGAAFFTSVGSAAAAFSAFRSASSLAYW